MDLCQLKLNKTEWDSIEIPVSKDELNVLKMITEGFSNVNIKKNNVLSLLGYLKVHNSKSNMSILNDFIYFKYFRSIIEDLCQKNKYTMIKIKNPETKIKKADKYRIENMDKQLNNKTELYEYILLDMIKNMLEHKINSKEWISNYYTIYTLMSYSIQHFNEHVKYFINLVMKSVEEHINISKIFQNSYNLIEKNICLLKYADQQLYEHQKKLFTICKAKHPKLVLYTAPTGTGKTISPIGLSESHKIIFVCAARHVGLALAKAAISLEKKVAFAFGCRDVEDIRLHYFSAKEYTKDRRSGRIRRVDNSVGDKVEIMICDIKSYVYAMYYMKAFNKVDDIITYWDEPTITMDYEYHELHGIINNLWKQNIIPNIVLSSATLPSKEEIMDMIIDYKCKFDNSEVYEIVSNDCIKTIPLIRKEGYVDMPHYMFDNYDDIISVAKHCNKNKTLMRYLDLSEIIRFVMYVNKNNYIKVHQYNIDKYFNEVSQINMRDIKLYYLVLLKNIIPEKWANIYNYLMETRKQYHKSNISVTTSDAATLTDGPTIFLADNVKKISQMCIQTAQIPSRVLNDISDSIHYNNVLNKKIMVLEKALEDKISAKDDKDKKDKKIESGRGDGEMRKMMMNIEELRSMVRSVSLNSLFVPNSKDHYNKWMANKSVNYIKSKVFTSSISDDIIEKIMLINDVEATWKLLLMMGIGVFAEHTSITYTEIMKNLADNQQLYLIIASSDYIYGTNYQFCHGYISKDLELMSQDKCIQAMGRIGRTKLQYDYSLRFRENSLIKKIFMEDKNKPEVKNINKLLSSN